MSPVNLLFVVAASGIAFSVGDVMASDLWWAARVSIPAP
jgi:hypothetical protein